MKRLDSRRDILLALPIALIAFAIRLKGIHGIDLGLDGGLSLAVAALPPSAALQFLAHDVHPPLFYLLLHLWIASVGSAPFSAKFFGVLSGILAIVALYGWVRSFAGPLAATAASLLLAVSPVAVEIDLTVREYSLAVLLMIVAVGSATRRPTGGRVRFIVLGTLAVWTSYLALTVPLIAALGAMWRRDTRRLVDGVTIGASILPWLGFATLSGFLAVFQSAGPRQQTVAGEPLLPQLSDAFRMLDGGVWLQPEWLGPLALGAAIVVVAVAVWRMSDGLQSSARVLPLAWLGIAVLNVAAAILVNTYWTREGLGVRYIAPALPFVFAFLGMGIVCGLRRVPFVGVVALALLVVPNLLGTLAWYRRPTLPPSFWDPTALVATLDARTAPHDGIVFVSAEQAGYYQALSEHPRPWVLIPAGTDYLQGDVTRRADAELPELTRQSRAIWLVVYRGVVGEGTSKLNDWLSLRDFAVTPITLPDSEIDPYLTDAALHESSAQTYPGVAFADSVRLLGATAPTVLLGGGVLPVDLRWQASTPPSRDLKVFVHLINQNGAVVSQHDSPPANGRAPVPRWQAGQIVDDRHGLLIPNHLPSGTYWLEVGLYDGDGRLSLLKGGDTVRLGPIRVKD